MLLFLAIEILIPKVPCSMQNTPRAEVLSDQNANATKNEYDIRVQESVEPHGKSFSDRNPIFNFFCKKTDN